MDQLYPPKFSWNLSWKFAWKKWFHENSHLLYCTIFPIFSPLWLGDWEYNVICGLRRRLHKGFLNFQYLVIVRRQLKWFFIAFRVFFNFFKLWSDGGQNQVVSFFFSPKANMKFQLAHGRLIRAKYKNWKGFLKRKKKEQFF